jgi:hypothetical protein
MGVGFRKNDGQEADGALAIFPIVKKIDGLFKLVGTAFFISNTGLFVTAKHVMEDVLDKDMRLKCPIYGLQLLENNKYFIRQILRYSFNTKSDIVVGVLRALTHKKTGSSGFRVGKIEHF